MKITIPLVHKLSMNKVYAGLHWATKNKIKEKYYAEIKKAGILYRPDYAIDLTVTFYFKSRVLDCTNCFPMVKMIEDGLVKEGVLKDDSPQYVQSVTCISKKDLIERIEVEIK